MLLQGYLAFVDGAGERALATPILIQCAGSESEVSRETLHRLIDWIRKTSCPPRSDFWSIWRVTRHATQRSLRCQTTSQSHPATQRPSPKRKRTCAPAGPFHTTMSCVNLINDEFVLARSCAV
jgi:hypothetical protein